MRSLSPSDIRSIALVLTLCFVLNTSASALAAVHHEGGNGNAVIGICTPFGFKYASQNGDTPNDSEASMYHCPLCLLISDGEKAQIDIFAITTVEYMPLSSAVGMQPLWFDIVPLAQHHRYFLHISRAPPAIS